MGAVLDNRRVRYLYESAVTGSVRAAADKLDLNPSVVSRQIARMEEDLAVPLLERHGRGVKPTEAGLLLVEYYRQQCSYEDDLVTKLQELRGMARGHINLVLGEGFVSDLMAEPLQAFWQRHPGLTLTLDLAGTNEVLRKVAEDQAHIGLVYHPPVTASIRSRAAIRQPMCAITVPGHPLARMPRQPLLRQVAEYPLALMHGSYGTRQIIHLAEQMDRIRLTPKLTTDSISVIKHFVRGGLGVTLLPAFAVSQEIDAGQLVATPIDNPLLAGAEAHIVTRLGRQLSIAANQLLLQLMASMRAFQGTRQGAAPAGARARGARRPSPL
ncbi:LysR family transcriptional regulator [Paracidovorax anthurii]|uniref:DNA-binding transcriptional LysR family regulator n=1 Tax=Paracidovorax anthurii TaxID=78229 RepID=A0A328YX02_9BURK|nr:LysR family transcriptional regulator [Paracidovorax anthurii]RAR77673.1 DNA-binding transcriptional LysR family regulator [Paracidovorax anthurii]WCM93176.1 LysR family transcriptional regulator [Acidovorax sp. NCPPB 2350]